MDKLIELLNEREKKEINQTYEWHNLWEFVFADNLQTGQNMDSSESASILIAKKYWFIKWLVDNDKIEKYKVIELEHNWIRPFKLDNLYWEIKLEERLLMLLSIQDNPIEFLVSILK